MKVTYRKTILELLDDEIYKAQEHGREIQEITLSSWEWRQLREALMKIGAHRLPSGLVGLYSGTATYLGVTIRREQAGV